MATRKKPAVKRASVKPLIDLQLVGPAISNSANQTTYDIIRSGKEIFRNDYYVYNKKGVRLRKWFKFRSNDGYNYRHGDNPCYHWPPVLDQIDRIWNAFQKCSERMKILQAKRSAIAKQIMSGEHGWDGNKIWYAHAQTFEPRNEYEHGDRYFEARKEEWSLFSISGPERYEDESGIGGFSFSENGVEAPLKPLKLELGNEFRRLNTKSDKLWRIHHYLSSLMDEALRKFIEDKMTKSPRYADKVFVLNFKGNKFIYNHQAYNRSTHQPGVVKVHWPSDLYEEVTIE